MYLPRVLLPVLLGLLGSKTTLKCTAGCAYILKDIALPRIVMGLARRYKGGRNLLKERMAESLDNGQAMTAAQQISKLIRWEKRHTRELQEAWKKGRERSGAGGRHGPRSSRRHRDTPEAQLGKRTTAPPRAGQPGAATSRPTRASWSSQELKSELEFQELESEFDSQKAGWAKAVTHERRTALLELRRGRTPLLPVPTSSARWWTTRRPPPSTWRPPQQPPRSTSPIRRTRHHGA